MALIPISALNPPITEITDTAIPGSPVLGFVDLIPAFPVFTVAGVGLTVGFFGGVGLTESTGSMGFTGIAGSVGFVGSTGLVGSSGFVGFFGSSGFSGSVGCSGTLDS